MNILKNLYLKRDPMFVDIMLANILTVFEKELGLTESNLSVTEVRNGEVYYCLKQGNTMYQIRPYVPPWYIGRNDGKKVSTIVTKQQIGQGLYEPLFLYSRVSIFYESLDDNIIETIHLAIRHLIYKETNGDF